MAGGARTRPPRIVVVGSTMVDLSAFTSRIPARGETVVGERFAMGFGGKGANQAVMARLLGAEVAMVNRVGDDVFGPMTIENLVGREVDATHVRIVPGPSGIAEVWVEPDGTNRILIFPGANERLTEADAVDAVVALPAADVVLGQLEIPQVATAAAFRAAHARGALTILNPAPAHRLEDALLAASDWLIPNEVELGVLADGDGTDDATLAAFAARIGARVAVTLGEAGAALVTAEGDIVRIPADRVTAVDSTGAGDAFVGGFAVGLASGLDEVSAVQLGIACASDSVTRAGTMGSFAVPDRARAMLAEADRTP